MSGESGSLTRQSYLDRLQEWADGRGLEISTVGSTQQEPTHVVAVKAQNRAAALVKRESADSIETAAFYVWNTLERLGAIDG